MPLELQLKAEAYRLCQPMHVLSFGEGRMKWKKFWVVSSSIWDRGPCSNSLLSSKRNGKIGNSCDYQHTWRHRGYAGNDGLRGDSIEKKVFFDENSSRSDKTRPGERFRNVRVFP